MLALLTEETLSNFVSRDNFQLSTRGIYSFGESGGRWTRTSAFRGNIIDFKDAGVQRAIR